MNHDKQCYRRSNSLYRQGMNPAWPFSTVLWKIAVGTLNYIKNKPKGPFNYQSQSLPSVRVQSGGRLEWIRLPKSVFIPGQHNHHSSQNQWSSQGRGWYGIHKSLLCGQTLWCWVSYGMEEWWENETEEEKREVQTFNPEVLTEVDNKQILWEVKTAKSI